MGSITCTAVQWYVDPDAEKRGEPGIRHSFMASLATAIHHNQGDLDPVWLLGASSFAFRIMVNEILCPSAMSVFDWQAILPEAVENAGFHCLYKSRLWGGRRPGGPAAGRGSCRYRRRSGGG